MPNTSNDDVIIVGSLSDKELRDSIDKLVDYVGDKTTIMAGKFDVAMEKMKSAMKDFAITQKVSVDLMQDAWKQMSASFDAMLKAQQNATSSGNNSGAGGGNSQYADNTVGHLQEIIALEEKRRKEMTLNSDELRTQNELIETLKSQLKYRTTSDQTKVAQAARKELQAAFTLPARELADAEKKLKELQALSAKFNGKGILDPAQWNRLQTQIQATQEKIDKLRQKKPTSIQDVLGMDESSVDAIAKKMAALKKVTVDPQNTAQVKQLGDEYQRLKRLQAELMGQNIQMTHSNNYLAQSFGYIRNRLVYAMTLGAITSFTKQVYEIRGQYELLERSLGVLVNSFERGSQIFQELNQMAIESPFTLMELAGAAKQLTAYNFAANEVVDTTRRLADISAALGVPMERLTYNLGQIRAQTVLTARDARDFANAGLPIVASLAEHFTELEGKIVTTGDVYDRMSKKMVSYSDVMAVLNKMTDEGGKFFDFQSKQAETLRVQMANLNLAWNNMLNDIGKSNQGLLTLPISGLKALLQNWQTIDRVLKSMLYTFVGWKALQMVAIRQQWAWATATGATAKQMGFLANATKGLFASMKALFLNPWTWVFVGIMAVIDLVRQTNAAREAMHELNQEIRDNANEASESLLSYLNNKGNQSTRQLAQQNKLTAEQGEKAWESVSEQIKQSALSANSLIAELLAIPDVNERVAKSFDYAERIQKAQAALQDLRDDSFEVTTDVGWGGMFGEGLVSDLKDFTESLKMSKSDFKELQTIFEHGVGHIGRSYKEFSEELDVTAESINNFIRAYNITDPLQINEILERVRSQIKAKNPEIKGEAAKIFDIELDKKMATLTNGAVDENETLWRIFLERLKNHYHHAFEDITDEWVKTGKGLSKAQEKEQKEAIDKNLEYFKDAMPQYYDAVAKMVANASQLRIHIGIAFNVQQLSDFQKEVKQRISSSAGVLDFGGGAFLPTNNDNLSSWVKTQQQAIKSLGEENKKYALDNTQWSKKKIADNDREIQQRKNLLDLFHQQYTEEKNIRKGGNRKPEDVVAEALKQELQLIKEMQSNYDKLRKSGVSNMDAIDLASKGYEATIIRINQVLSKFGIGKFNAANFAGKDVRSLLQSLEEQRKALLASGKVKTSSLKDLDVEIQKLTVDAKTYDMKKITDGLNSELGKLKDEYELAIELDANPELGDMFADMFGINTSTLPKTFGDALDRAQTIINRKLAELNITTPFDLMEGNIDSFAKSTGLSKESAVFKELVSVQNTWRGMFKKNITETEKVLDDYIKKYGDYSDKIAEIEAGRLEKLKKLNEAYYTEEMRKRPEYAAKLNAIEQGASKEKQQVDFDEFKNSRYYTMMFENLDYISTKTIRDMRDRVRELMDTMNDLTPEQLKTLMSQYEKLEQKLTKRSPFKTLTKDLKEYFSTSKERNAANQEFKNAQKEYDAQKKNVAALKEKYEQAKANTNTSQSYLDFLQIEIDGENKILQILKQQLAAAQKKADKYNLTAKLAKSEALAVANVVAQNLQSLGELRDFLQQDLGIELSDELNGLVDGLSKVGQGINKITSSATSGDVVGVITGVAQTIYGLYDGIASLFGGGSAKDKKIVRQIENSEKAVKRLELAYKNLEFAIEQAYGSNAVGAKQAAIANKELQLVELERQLRLEQSRESKHRDEERIIAIKGEIIELKNEIKKSYQEVTTDLLGISSVASAAEEFMSQYIDALRKGEDAQAAFTGSFKDMIANMIKQLFVTKVIGPQLDALVDDMNERITSRSKAEADAYQNAVKEQTELEDLSDAEIRRMMREDSDFWDGFVKSLVSDKDIALYRSSLGLAGQIATDDEIRKAIARQRGLEGWSIPQELLDEYREALLKQAESDVKEAKRELNKATTPTIEDLDIVAQAGKDLLPLLQATDGQINELLDKYDLYDDQSNKTLSALQQGIQGITEDTAGAIEGYMSIISQRMFEQGGTLVEIRDLISNLDLDVMLGTQSQILLQLQSSYQTQNAIRSILEGWSNPSGMGVRVELVS